MYNVQGPCINAILNFACQVDAVMEMFPHLTDAQKLAAEILRLKAQGEVFWSSSPDPPHRSRWRVVMWWPGMTEVQSLKDDM